MEANCTALAWSTWHRAKIHQRDVLIPAFRMSSSHHHHFHNNLYSSVSCDFVIFLSYEKYTESNSRSTPIFDQSIHQTRAMYSWHFAYYGTQKYFCNSYVQVLSTYIFIMSTEVDPLIMAIIVPRTYS